MANTSTDLAAELAGNLPGDIMIDILSRIPAKSLIRFKCAGKSWCASFTSSGFATKHLVKHSSLSNNGFILVKAIDRRTTKPMSKLLYCEAFRGCINLLAIPSAHRFALMDLVGSCNGLVCLVCGRGYYSLFFLWNPSTREKESCPVSDVFGRKKVQFGSVAHGFGFDSKNNDYKIVRLVSFYYIGEYNIHNGAEVFTLSTNCWREVESFDCRFCNVSCTGVFLNGAVHWVGYGQRKVNDAGPVLVIVSFDLSKDRFRVIPSPESANAEAVFKMQVFDESLGLITCESRDLVQWYHIWVMKEYGVEESWTRLYSIGPFTLLQKPLGYSINGGFLIELNDGELAMYDPHSHKIEKLGILGVPGSFEVVHYVDSLVSVRQKQR